MSDISHIEKLIDIYGKLPTEANKRRIMQLVDELGNSRELEGSIDEAKRAANHNNSEYTSDYLEDRILKLESQKEKTQ